MDKNELKDKLTALKGRFAHFSQKEKNEFKTAYNEAVNVLEDKTMSTQQRKVELNKTFSKYTKKIIAVVVSALMLVSPVLLSGCDEDTFIGSNQIQNTTMTDSEGNVIEEPTGEVEIDTSVSNVVYEPIEEKYKERIMGLFGYWDINKVIDKEYSTMVENAIAETKVNKKVAWKKFDQLYLSLERMLKDNAEYSVKVNLRKANQGADIKFYRKGTDTATFIISKDGKTYYNGIVNNKAYYEGAEYISTEIPILLNEETAGIFNQLEQKDLGKLYGNELLSYIFLCGLPENHDGYYHSGWLHGGTEESLTAIDSGDFESTMFGARTDKEAVVDSKGNVIQPAETKYGPTDVSLVAHVVYPDKPELFDIDKLKANPVLATFSIEAGDIGWNEMNHTYFREGYRIVDMEVDYSPENIVLPTTEEEAQR